MSMPNTPTAMQVELRMAAPADSEAVARLAALDEQRELEWPVLMALVEGEPVAALSMYDGRSVADPFVLTRDIVSLLRLRAEHLSAAASAPRRRRLRLRPATA